MYYTRTRKSLDRQLNRTIRVNTQQGTTIPIPIPIRYFNPYSNSNQLLARARIFHRIHVYIVLCTSVPSVFLYFTISFSQSWQTMGSRIFSKQRSVPRTKNLEYSLLILSRIFTVRSDEPRESWMSVGLFIFANLLLHYVQGKFT